jgi:hypothetical protein
LKKKELAKQTKLVEIGHGILHRVRMIDSSSTDQEYVEELRLFTAAINPDMHAAQLEQFSNAATEAIDNADALHELEELATADINGLGFTAVDMAEPASTVANDDDLIKALGLLAAGREQNASASATTNSASSSSMQPVYPDVPADHVPKRRTAMAVDTDGKTSVHDVSQRKVNAKKEKDQFAAVFW